MAKLNYIALGAAGLAAISVFLPWVEASSSASFGGYSANYSSGGISGISIGGGIFGLLVALAGGFMAFKNIKFAFIAGALNFLNGLGYMLGWFGAMGGGSYSSSFEGASARASVDPQFGLYLFVLASLVFVIFTLKNLKEANINTNFSNPQQNIPQQKPVEQQYQQPVTPILQEVKPIIETSKPIQVEQPIYQSSNNVVDTQNPSFDLGQWFDKNKKSVIIAGGGLVALLVLFVALKFVFSLDFSKNKDTNQTVNEVQTPLPSTQSNTQPENTNVQTVQPHQVETVSTVGQNQIGYYIANGNTTTKIYFYNSPDVTTRRKAYLSTQETVYVQKVENGFGYIEFTNRNGQTSYGWVEMQYLIVKPN